MLLHRHDLHAGTTHRMLHALVVLALLLMMLALCACDQQAPVPVNVAQAAVVRTDLRCLTRRPEDCLDNPVPVDEPHGGRCATCHDMWQNTASHSARSCSDAGCHEDAQKLSRFHQTLRAVSLANCTHCHRPHEFRVAGDGRQCTVCHQGGGQRVVWGDTPAAVSAVVLVDKDITFWHSDHASLTCVSCHGADSTHMMTTVRAPQDCRSCHHSAAKSSECLGCHAADKVFSSPIRVTTALNINVGALNRPKRVLSFEHALHKSYACTTCHTAQHGIESTKRADCSTCHLEHHTATSDCAACHDRPARNAHTRQAHLGCTGAGCHVNVPAAIQSVPRTRELCLSCHTERTQHEGGRNCAECHMPALDH